MQPCYCHKGWWNIPSKAGDNDKKLWSPCSIVAHLHKVAHFHWNLIKLAVILFPLLIFAFPKVAHHSLNNFIFLYASLFLCFLDLCLGNGQLCPFYARYLFLWPCSHFCKLRKVYFWKYYSAVTFILAMLCWKCAWHDWWLNFDPVDIWRKNILFIKSCYPIFCEVASL